MKKLGLLFGLSFVVIAACMIYLVKTGVSLRSAPMIKPMPLADDYGKLASNTLLRLYPDFHEAHYILIGLPETSPEAETFLALLKEDYRKTFGIEVNTLLSKEFDVPGSVESCPKPCWLVTTPNKANTLSANPLVETRIIPSGESFFTLSLMPFTKDEPISQECDQEQRVSFECIGPLSVREVARKLKNPEERYFFMRKYNEKDHFLFIESPHQGVPAGK